MNNKNLSYWTSTVALAGFLFGFDTVVISGANQPIQDLWGTGNMMNGFFHGLFIMSMALWGTVIGALLGGIPTEKFGRKKVLFWIGVLYTASALGSALAWDPYSFSFFRFIGGLGVGASSVTVPTYLSEIAPENKRGQMVARYQFMIVFGIFIAFFSNYLLHGIGGENDWRYMLGIEALPAIIYTILVMGVPRSPRWLITKRNNLTEAKGVLTSMGIADVNAAVEHIKKFAANKTESFWNKKYRWPVILAFLIAFFNQLSGINFILYYAPEILDRAGLAGKDSLLSSISIGLINLVFTMLGMYLIDRVGRKTLMLWGSLGYILGLSMVAYCFYAGLSSVILLSFILVFIAAHAIGQGAVIWVFISEIFPNNVRGYGQAFGSGTHWVFAAIITMVTPIFLNESTGIFKDNPWPIFAFFAGFMILQLLFVLFMMPETKGKSLEALEMELTTK